MGQHLLTIHVTNGIDAFLRCLKVFIHLDARTLIILNASIGEVGLYTRFPARSHQDYISIDICDILYGSLHLEGNTLPF